MKKYINIAWGCLVVIVLAGCKDIYNIPDEVKNIRLLVVEGQINTGAGATLIKLSRTVNLKDTASIKPELKATVTVEGENGSIYTLSGNTKGEYSNAQLPINPGVKYRLRIKTTENKEYLSEYLTVVNAPPIDSVNWQRKESGIQTGIQIYVNTHDPQNNTKYYRWEYDETWEFHSPYFSGYEYKNNLVVPRADPSKTYICWKSESSTQIFVGSTAKLSQDQVSLFPLNIVPFSSRKITVRYSILVKQYALTKEAYEYWDILKKNTEDVGTLFDAQPSNLTSNINCVTQPNEKVIGFISAGAVSEKRIFILSSEVDPWYFFHNCLDERLVSPNDYKYYFGTNNLLLPTRQELLNGIVVGYWGGEPLCVDCTLTGSNIKPSFW